MVMEIFHSVYLFIYLHFFLKFQIKQSDESVENSENDVMIAEEIPKIDIIGADGERIVDDNVIETPLDSNKVEDAKDEEKLNSESELHENDDNQKDILVMGESETKEVNQTSFSILEKMMENEEYLEDGITFLSSKGDNTGQRQDHNNLTERGKGKDGVREKFTAENNLVGFSDSLEILCTSEFEDVKLNETLETFDIIEYNSSSDGVGNSEVEVIE